MSCIASRYSPTHTRGQLRFGIWDLRFTSVPRNGRYVRDGASIGLKSTPPRTPRRWTQGAQDARKSRIQNPKSTQQLKLVSAAGVAPAVTPSRTEHVTATLRAVAPANGWRRGLVSVEDGTGGLGRTGSIEDWRTRRGLHPQPSRRQRGALLIELRVRRTRNAKRGARNDGCNRWLMRCCHAPRFTFRTPRLNGGRRW